MATKKKPKNEPKRWLDRPCQREKVHQRGFYSVSAALLMLIDLVSRHRLAQARCLS